MPRLMKQERALHRTTAVMTRWVLNLGGVGLLDGHCLWQQYFEKKLDNQ